MVKLWNRIQSMENDRLPKILMDWDRKLALEGRINWNWHFREIMADCDHIEVFDLQLCLGCLLSKEYPPIRVAEISGCVKLRCGTSNLEIERGRHKNNFCLCAKIRRWKIRYVLFQNVLFIMI